MWKLRVLISFLCWIGLESFLGTALAATDLASKFCQRYPNYSECATGHSAPCQVCHQAPPELNSYGQAIRAEAKAAGVSRADLSVELEDLLTRIEDQDSDKDGVDNRSEIEQGSLPGDPNSKTSAARPMKYDHRKALTRIMSHYCGRRPTYALQESLAKATDKSQFLHAELDKCLSSSYWLTTGLRQLADGRIKPVKALGMDGDVVLADYEWDYRLFTYALSGNRDARDLLLADYHVDANNKIVTGKIGRQRPFTVTGPGGAGGPAIVLGTGQPLEVARRAGMITTQWFLMMNTMFSEIPRTSAAQALRAYLGLDIAKSEGLTPIVGEPRDVDNKNVKQDACAVCHSTLDPLAYAFSTYNGIEATVSGALFNASGAYNASRTPYGADGFLFGEPVKDLREWAQKAANSTQFIRSIGMMFFKDVMGREPAIQEREEFEQVTAKLSEEKYAANKLIHRLIDMQAFGGVYE